MIVLKENLRAALLIVFGVAVLTVAPVAAEHGSSGTSGSGSGDSQVSTTTNTTTNTETETDGTSAGSDSSNTNETPKLRAQQMVSELKTKHKEHTEDQRQKFCTQHQSDINTKVGNLGTRAQKHLDTFNKIFEKVKAFHDKGQLTSPDYDTLVATATEKQTAAQTAVDSLKALSGTTIDCSSPDIATTLASIKTAANDAKSALQAYRSAIKDVVKALQSANSNKNKSTDSSTNTNTNSDTNTTTNTDTTTGGN